MPDTTTLEELTPRQHTAALKIAADAVRETPTAPTRFHATTVTSLVHRGLAEYSRTGQVLPTQQLLDLIAASFAQQLTVARLAPARRAADDACTPVSVGVVADPGALEVLHAEAAVWQQVHGRDVFGPYVTVLPATWYMQAKD
ncbi:MULTISPECIES: hypothetical protein [Frankia]|uniref:Uncharacterized protein n=1 Tax=Frankia alni (strain DSM 45986 / CECT 9034 / ACN14a) TaxID=326424 RepID=Q0RM43_FRAAA|nr:MULTISPECIES: hypothetical protein [Frankia]CAJ61409.1 hypothetical protein FRAAL2765 [Frankia alni ACN14a]